MAPLMPWQNVVKATVADRAALRQIMRLVDDWTPKVRDAFLETVRLAEGRVDVQGVASLIRRGQYTSAIDLAERALVSGNQLPLADVIRNNARAAAVDAFRAMQPAAPTEFMFGQMSNAVRDQLDDYGFGLIRELGKRAREATADVIRSGLGGGTSPLIVAQDIKKHIGLTRRQSRAVRNFRRMLEQRDSEALTRMLRDKKFDERLLRSFAEGGRKLPKRSIEMMTERYRQRYLTYRSEMIARTEATRATNAGNHAAWQQAVARGLFREVDVRRRWSHSDDEKVRHSHWMIPSMNADGVGLEEAFDSPLGKIMYPGDPDAPAENTVHCRCGVIIRAQRGYGRR